MDDTMEDAAISKIAEYHAFSVPSSNSTVTEIDWFDEDEDILFLIGMEEDYDLDIDELKKEAFLAGEISIANLLTGEELLKEAQISTPEEKAKKRIYSLQHAIQIKRKAKKRRKQIKQGLIRPTQRLGSAASGYTFIPAAGGNAGNHSEASFQHTGHTDYNFDPHKAPNASVLQTSGLNKFALEMPTNAMQGAAYNKQNPIAGMQGFPSMPPKPTVNTPQIKTPKAPKKINFTKVLPKPIINQG